MRRPSLVARAGRRSLAALAAVLFLGVAGGCASSRVLDGTDASGDDTDAATTDAPLVDAAVIDAPVDAPTDAPVDAAVDAPTDACVPVWTNLLANPAFDDAAPAPWTQSSTIVRMAAQMPFMPHSQPSAALFGATNNADDVLTQSVTIPAGATALRLRGHQCHVTSDATAGADTFEVTLATSGGTIVETLASLSNADVAATCAWQPFEYTATSPHAGDTLVLRLRGRTSATFLTRFVVDSLALDILACP